MDTHHNVYARLERVKTLWGELSKTPRKSKQYQVLAQEIRAEAIAYLAGVDAARTVERRRRTADRRQNGPASTERRVDRRQIDRRKMMSGPVSRTARDG
jgi:hypothetical protein